MLRSFTVKDITLIAVLVAIIEVAKIALSFLPNIELVTVLIIVDSVAYRKISYPVIFVFVLIEGLLYGFGLWWFGYLYAWPLLSFVVKRIPKNSNVLIYALVACLFGLLFGTMMAIPFLFIGQASAMLGYIVAGIPYDMIHAINNFITTLVLFVPLTKALSKISNQH